MHTISPNDHHLHSFVHWSSLCYYPYVQRKALLQKTQWRGLGNLQLPRKHIKNTNERRQCSFSRRREWEQLERHDDDLKTAYCMELPPAKCISSNFVNLPVTGKSRKWIMTSDRTVLHIYFRHLPWTAMEIQNNEVQPLYLRKSAFDLWSQDCIYNWDLVWPLWWATCRRGGRNWEESRAHSIGVL